MSLSKPIARTLSTCMACVCLILAGCGFQLRGSIDIDILKQELNTRYLTQHEDNTFKSKLNSALSAYGIHPTPNAHYTLLINNIEYERASATFESDARVDEYALHLRVSFTVIRNSDAKRANFVAEAERIYSYDADEETAKAEQQTLLKDELYDNVVRRVVSHYLRFSPKE